MINWSRVCPGQSWLLACILLAGLCLRLLGVLWGQGYFHFGQGDGVAAYSVAVDYGDGESKAQYLGQPRYNAAAKLPGTLWTIFCFESLRWGGSIKGVQVAMVLLNTITIYLVYLLTLRTLGAAPALWAALFASTLPWVVFYSSSVYNPEVMPVLSALLGLALWNVTRQERSWVLFWVPVLLLAMPQFHMSGLMFWPAAVLLLFLAPVRLHLAWLAAGVAAGLALYIPYLRGDMANHWQNTLGFFAGGDPHPFVERFKALSAPLSFLVNWAPRWVRTAADYHELGRACFGSFGVLLVVNLLSAVVAGMLLLGGFQMLRPALRDLWRRPRQVFGESPGPVFLAVLALLPLVVALFANSSFHTRYCLVLVPPAMGLLGGGAAWLLTCRLRPLFQVLAAVSTATNLWLMPAMYWHQGRRIEQGSAFVPSFDRLEFVYQQLNAHAGHSRPITVEDAAYLGGPAHGNEVLSDAGLIRRFVEVREKETRRGLSPSGAPIVYRLEPARPGHPPDASVAVELQGIVLTTVPHE
jgi:hypothetical protein